MKKIACLGPSSFTMGFALAGVTTIMAPEQDIMQQIARIKEDPTIGIVIIDETLLAPLQGPDRADIEESVSPVFMALSDKEGADNIRKLIMKSIGVDLWKTEGEQDE